MKPLHCLIPVLALSCGISAPPLRPQPAMAPLLPVATVAPSATAAPTGAPPPEGPGPCDPGVAVDPAKVEAPVHGSFSAPRRDEVAGELPCSAFQSGFALLRRTGGRIELVRLDLFPDRRWSRSGCRALRTSTGRDLLVCLDEAITYGQHDQSVVVIDYARDEEHAVSWLVSVSDTTDTCDAGPNAVAAGIDGFDLLDIDGDGATDVEIRVRAAEVRLPPRPDCQMGTLGSGNPPKVPRPPQRIVRFVSRGDTLVPTPASVPVLAALAALKR